MESKRKEEYCELTENLLGPGPYAFVTVNPDLTVLKRTAKETEYFALGTELVQMMKNMAPLDAHMCFWKKYINRLNEEFYGKSYRMKQRALTYVGVLENSGKSYSGVTKEFHAHILFSVAETDYEDFCDSMNYCWNRYVYVPKRNSRNIEISIVDSYSQKIGRYFLKQFVNSAVASDRFFFNKFRSVENEEIKGQVDASVFSC